ncbi:MAG TPA: YggT family protein [Gammaproteobacteria bacterium]|nr:YggT family protein [Gammaproteobacteria bacterium]
MTGQYFINSASFVIQTLFGLYILAVLLRFLFQLLGAHFRNPISQFIVTLTNPALRPLRRIIPGYGGIDFSALLLMLALQVLELLLISFLYGTTPSVAGLLILATGKLLEMTVYIFMFAVFARIIISWVNPHLYNHMTSLLRSLTDFMMRPASQLIPPIGMLDLSPIIVFLILGLLLRMIVQPILDIGTRMLL